MSENKPIIIDLAKLKTFKYAQIDILNAIKDIVVQNNIILATLSQTLEYNIQALINIENASTKPDDPKITYYE